MELTDIGFKKIGDFEFGWSFVAQEDNLLNAAYSTKKKKRMNLFSIHSGVT